MIVRYKKGNRWKSSTKEYQYRRWRKNVFELNKRTKGLSKYYVCLKCDKKIERVYSKADRKEFACKIWYNTLRNQFLVDTQINGKGE